MKAKLTRELSLILDDPLSAENLMRKVVLAKKVSVGTKQTTINTSGKSYKVRGIHLSEAAAVKG